MNELETMLAGIIGEPDAEDRWLVLADWLEEFDDPRRAELLRLHRRLVATCCEPEAHPRRAVWQARVVELLGQGVEPCVPRKAVRLAEGVGMHFAFIPPGTFLMGSPEGEPARDGDEEAQHRVTLTKGCYLGTHPVTQGQWQALMGANPSHFKGESLPVETVSWDDCQKFIQKLGKGFGLPTEGEWEYACRAGTTTPFHFGPTISTGQANFNGNYPYGKGEKGVYPEKTTPVGSFPCNAWGLFDMHGNVWEWCSDWYGKYGNKDIKDPQGSNKDTCRVVRGGSWVGSGWSCRAAGRNRGMPGCRNDSFGLRVCFRLV